ncbi:MAG: hypothetical protein WC806_03015 [Candidatus Gracilibacteria bacterium]|jgi:hypothetical protein
MEHKSESLDLEIFQTTLAQKTEEYAKFVYHIDQANNKQKAAKLYQELLEICTDALIGANKDKNIIQKIENIIHQTLIWYRPTNSYPLFTEMTKAEFYRKLAMNIVAA